MEKILVLGASPNEARVSNLAVHRLKSSGYEPIPVGIRDGEIAGIEIIKGEPKIENLIGVSLYLNAQRQEQFYDYIIDLNPRYVIFNPGTENPAFTKLLRENNIETIIACNLTMLALNDMPI